MGMHLAENGFKVVQSRRTKAQMKARAAVVGRDETFSTVTDTKLQESQQGTCTCMQGVGLRSSSSYSSSSEWAGTSTTDDLWFVHTTMDPNGGDWDDDGGNGSDTDIDIDIDPAQRRPNDDDEQQRQRRQMIYRYHSSRRFGGGLSVADQNPAQCPTPMLRTVWEPRVAHRRPAQSQSPCCARGWSHGHAHT